MVIKGCCGVTNNQEDVQSSKYSVQSLDFGIKTVHCHSVSLIWIFFKAAESKLQLDFFLILKIRVMNDQDDKMSVKIVNVKMWKKANEETLPFHRFHRLIQLVSKQ